VGIASSDVTVRGFIMKNANTGATQSGIYTTENLHNVTIDGNDLGFTELGQPLGLGLTSDSKVTNNQIHDGGVLGMASYKNTRLLIQGNHFFRNNVSNSDPWHEAGTLKAVGTIDSQIVDNEVGHNAGPGIWCDIACDNVLIARNTLHDQPYNPIFYEISTGGEISNNTITASLSSNVWGCVVVSSSASMYVHDNTCSDAPIRIILDNRSDKPAAAGTNVRIENNRAATSWWQYDPLGPLVVGQNGNTS
jgi:hypothetical protein